MEDKSCKYRYADGNITANGTLYTGNKNISLFDHIYLVICFFVGSVIHAVHVNVVTWNGDLKRQIFLSNVL